MAAIIDYDPSPTGLAFHRDTESLVKTIFGPVGAGKTTIALLDSFFTSLRQEPNADGVREVRWIVIRNTYSELKSTVIRSFMQWFGEFTRIVYDTPIRARMVLPLADGTTLDAEYLFLALDGEHTTQKLRSLEATAGLISECSEIDESVFEMLQSRINRFPVKNAHSPGATWAGVTMESNPPSVKSWLYRMLEITRPQGVKLYRQPSPLIYDDATGEYHQNPDAENLQYLGGGIEYYHNMIRTAREEYIKVYILGEYGVSFAGRPVFTSFSQMNHVSKQIIIPTRGVPLIIGMDMGLNPSAVFTQLGGGGQVAVLDALAPEDLTLDEFIAQHVLPLLQRKYMGLSPLIIGDPAGIARSALSRTNSFEQIRTFGLAARPAISNDIQLRLDSVKYFLNRRDGFAISPNCAELIEAMTGGYRYSKRGSTLDADYRDLPDKNKHSHIVDGLQYSTLWHWRGERAPTKKTVAAARAFKYA